MPERPCYNPHDRDGHNELGYDCDGLVHKNAPKVPSENKPWWNDGDKVAGLFATLLMMGLVCVGLALILKFCVWLLTGEWTV